MPPAVTLSTFRYKNREHIRIVFPYHHALKECVKSFPGTRWKSEWGCWHLPDTSALPALTAHLRKAGFEVRGSTAKVPPARTVSMTKDHPLAIRFRQFLEARRYSRSTQCVYGTFVQQFLEFMGDSDAEKATTADAELFLESLVMKRRIAISTHRQAISALKQFAVFLPGSAMKPEGLVRPKRSRKLPSVLSTAEIIRLLQATRNLKHRAITGLMYGCGLRVSELLALELASIDVDRQQVFIRDGKGRKDRRVVLADRFVPLLQNYLATYRPQRYFAEGRRGKRYSPTSIRAFLQRNAKDAGILKRVTPHTLRHSYATHLLEKGVDIRHIQELLGHAKPETTMVYTHVSRQDLLSIKSPLDLIFETPAAARRDFILPPPTLVEK